MRKIAIVNIKALITKVEASEEYKNWRNSNPKPFLSSIFTIPDSDPEECHLNYFDAEKEEINSFVVGEDIKLITHSEILSDGVPKELEPEKVSITFDKVLSIANDLMKKKYPNFKPARSMLVLQYIDGKQVWNISFFSALLHTLNIRIDASDGTVLLDKLLSIIHFEDTKKE